MARGEKFVTLYETETGTAVEVTEDRAEVLKERGYVDKKPRDFGKNAAPKTGVGRNAARQAQAPDNSAELAAKDAEIERLRADLEAATAPKQ